ncbi:NAD-dependent epimerase/dehydratase family protein [Psychrobacillus lasiicapitis]|uniref:NAD-dependent epimerase/dehydratase family protein n=1 Tax=Psychrobacillus lasiicapitis TaxID=1636719 RepID=UPI0014774CF6|nr:NAD-dependent epimerase/dehydratase family protein [Psychrobacillus lasiicapitis]GGA42583.1 UDP-glucose 4-epimerase [Psychrobacillus lasiicapitis]
MKVLVTGAAGFIGSHVVQVLLEQQFTVVAVDNLSTGKRDRIPTGVKFYEMDVTNNDVGNIFTNEQPDYVIHLAHQIAVCDSKLKPMKDEHASLLGTLNILRLSNEYKVKKCIFASSAAVYGNSSILPSKEDSKLAPRSFLTLCKLSAENYVQLYKKLFGLNSCILRFSNVFGPTQTNGVIISFLNCLLDGESPVIFNDGHQTRDFIYVKDAAAACIQALISESTGVFNISTSTEISIQQVFEELTRITGIQTNPVYETLREEEINRSVLSNEKAMSTFNWNPVYSLASGLEETVRETELTRMGGLFGARSDKII